MAPVGFTHRYRGVPINERLRQMDPNETLAKIRRIREKMASYGTVKKFDDDMEDLAWLLYENIGNLDEWLTSGGFLPKGWVPSDYLHVH